MTDRIGEAGALAYAIANPDTAASRLGASGALQGSIADAIANGTASASASRLTARGRILYAASQSYPQALFLSSAVGAWYVSAINTTYQDSIGNTSGAVGQSTGLLLDKSKGLTGLSTMYLGLADAYDYYVDATTGNDLNTGTSEVQAWASLNNISEAITSVGATVRVLVKSGTYNKATDYILITDAAEGSTTIVTFEGGCVMDGTTASATANTSGIYPTASGSAQFTVTVYGNGLTIQHYNYAIAGASPQGLGWAGTNVVVNVFDTTVDDTIDGISGHTDGHANLYRVTVKNSVKQLIANVSLSSMDCYNCSFQGTGTETAGFATDQDSTGLQRFYNCEFLPGTNPSTLFNMQTCEFYNSRFGTLTESMSVSSQVGGPNLFYMEDCFVNIRTQMFQGFHYNRCFGYFSGRVRNTTGTHTIENCVFSAPASGLTNILYSNFDDGGSCKLVVKNNIFETATAAAFMSVDVANSGYVVAASSEFFNNVLSSSAAYDADLVTADSGGTVIVGTVSADALIGAANTTNPDDYGYGVGSPAIGASSTGGNCGFAIGTVSAMTAQEVRGPSGVLGNHATQATAGNKSTLAATYLEIDALDDYMTTTAGGGGTTGILLVTAIRPSGTGTARTLWSDTGTNTGYKLTLDLTDHIVLSAGNGISFTSVTGPVLTDGTDYVVMAWHDGVNLNISVNNGTATTAAFATATAGTAGFSLWRDNGVATGYFGARMYCMVYRKNDTSTAAQRNAVYSYVAGNLP